MVKFEEEKQKKKIEELRESEEEDLAVILAQRYNLPYANLVRMTIDLDYLKLIPEDVSRNAKLVVFQGTGNNLQIALHDPNLEAAKAVLEDLKENKGYQIKLYLVSLLSLEEAWERYKSIPAFVELSKGIIDVSAEKMESFAKEIQTVEDLKRVYKEMMERREARKATEILELILGAAIQMDASDIHIEPQEKEARLRFRLDGVLQDVFYFESRYYQMVNSRIKLVSEMKINVHEEPQDGRFSIHMKGTEIEVRSSALPGPYGESVVLRLLNPKSINVEFDQLGMPKYFSDILLKEIGKPNGMILTTGPTGSGKTTIAEEVEKYLALRGYAYLNIGLDIFLKEKAWRGAIEKLVIGGQLTPQEVALLGDMVDKIKLEHGLYYDEQIFWNQEGILALLRLI